MRKVTEITAMALKNGDSITVSNTTVTDGSILSLYGNTIAIYDNAEGLLTLRDSGWRTVTTKERLNGVLDTFFNNPIKYGIVQRNYEWFFNTYSYDTNKGYIVESSEPWQGFKVLDVK